MNCFFSYDKMKESKQRCCLEECSAGTGPPALGLLVHLVAEEKFFMSEVVVVLQNERGSDDMPT